MKVLRILLICVSSLVILLAIVVALALNSSVQTWAVRKALTKDPEIRGDVAKVDVGLNQSKIEGLRIEQSGMTLVVPNATVDVSLRSAIGEKVLIKKLVAKGWTLDLTQPVTRSAPKALPAKQSSRGTGLPFAMLGMVQPAAAAEPAVQSGQPVFEGIFKLLELPVDVEVDAAELEGDVIFPTTTGEPPGRAHVVLTGGQLAPGKTAEFRISSSAALTSADTPVRDISAIGMLRAKMLTPRTFDWVQAEVDLTASGPQVPNGAKLHLNARAERKGGDEEYVLALQSLENGGRKQLLDVKARLPEATKAVEGNWAIDARDTDVGPFSLGLALPGFAANGRGQFQTAKDFSEIKAQGQFEGQVEKLAVLNPQLEALGKLNLKGDFDVVQHQDAMRIGRFSAEVAGARPVVSVQALQGIELNLGSGEIKVADPSRDLLQVKLHGVPLAWAQAFVPDVTFRGNDVTGEVVARAENNGVIIRSIQPVSINSLVVSQKNEVLVENVDVLVSLEGQYSPQGWQADVSELLLRTKSALWLEASLKAGQLVGDDQPLKVIGQYRVDLPLALQQPALRQQTQLSRGVAVGDFSAILADKLQQIATKLSVRQVAVPGIDAPIPNVAVQLRADVHENGLIKLQAPLVVQQGQRRSDIQVIAELKPEGAKQLIDAQVTSELMYVQDVQVLLAPFQSEASTPAQTPPVKPTQPQGPGDDAPKQEVPFWDGFGGELKLALKKVIYSPDVQAANVTGTLKIGPNAIAVESFRAVMGENSDARFNGGLNYNAKQKDAYSLTGDVKVANVNPGPILALMSSNGKATVEGQFDMAAKVNGAAPTPEQIADNVSADLKLTSRGGRFNGFAASQSAAAVGQVNKGISTIAELAGLFGGDNRASRIAARTKAVSEVLDSLAMIDFDQVNLELIHRPGESTKIKDFSLISPQIRFFGAGGIENTPGVHLAQRPLELQLQVGFRGRQAENMKLIGGLKSEPDALGYFPLLDMVPIRGSLSKFSWEAIAPLVNKYLLSGE